MPKYKIDKTLVWFGVSPTDATIHAYIRDLRLCDSASDPHAVSVITQRTEPACRRCIEIVNTADHDSRGARYGGG
jgi:hypothetical protein